VARIFICYRRDDASGYAGRLRDALSSQFGPAEIFRDIETIGPGDDFVQAMSRAIASCAVFLAIIGRHWLAAAAPDGTRRLDDPEDHVRGEIAEALKRGVRVIPVLVQGARMPPARELPEPLKGLAARHAIVLDDEGWESDVQRLAAAIRRELPAATSGGVETRSAPDGVAAGQDHGMFFRPGRYGYALATVGAAALLAVIVLFARGRTAESPSAASSSTTVATRAAGDVSTPTTTSQIPAGPQTPATLPAGGEAEVGEAAIEILDAGVADSGGASALILRIRLTNHSRYDALFSDGLFRLVLDEQARAPTSGLVELVPSETSKDGTVTFELPASAATARLEITAAGEKAEIPLDLTGRSGVTPTEDREARRAGSTAIAVPIDPAHREMRFGDLVCELQSATLRRYVNKLTLTLNLRAANRGRYDANFGDSNFRLVLDGNARAPVSGLNVIVPAEGTRDGDVVFDLPLDAKQVVLRARFGEATAAVPLQLPSRPS
jgi:hypothetical protein